MQPINQSWKTPEGKPDGGVSTGIGFTIAWQRGSLEQGRNGAFLLEVLESCLDRLNYYQTGEFACQENQEAIEQLEGCIYSLKSRLTRRYNEGKLGTHQKD